MSDQQNLVNDGNDSGKKKKGPRFMRHREKYSDDIQGFNVQDKSPIRNGLVRDRQCTDMFCGVLLVVCAIAFFGVAGYALTTGDPERIFSGVDGNQHVCGQPGKYLDYKYLLVVPYSSDEELVQQSLYARAVCVKECPKKGDLPACIPTNVTQCADFQQIGTGIADVITSFDTQLVFTSCLPDASAKAFNKQVSDGVTAVEEQLQVYKHFAWQIGVAIGLAIIFNIAYIYLLSRQTELMVKISVVGIELCYIAGMGVGVYAYMQSSPKNSGLLLLPGLLLFMFIFFNCVLFCYRDKVKVAIAVIDAAADYYAATKRLIFVSIFYFMLHILVFGLMCATVFFMLGTQTYVYNTDQLNRDNGQATKLSHPSGAFYGVIGFVWFMGIWINVFFSNSVAYVCSVGASSYYFSSSAEQEGSGEICLGFKWASVTNMGSLAFGAFIIAVLKVLRALAESAQNKGDSQGGAAAVVGCIVVCIVSCIQSYVDYIDHIAIAFMSVSGDSFCTSAWNGFLINLKHCVKFYFAQDIGGFFIFMGVVFITGINTLIFWGLTKVGNTSGADPLIPIISVAVLSFIVSVITLGLFDDAIRATLMCFAIDMDLNNGTPKFGPPTFHEKLEAIMDDKFADQYNNQVSEQAPVESYNAPLPAPVAPGYGAPEGYGAVPQQPVYDANAGYQQQPASGYGGAPAPQGYGGQPAYDQNQQHAAPQPAYDQNQQYAAPQPGYDQNQQYNQNQGYNKNNGQNQGY